MCFRGFCYRGTACTKRVAAGTREAAPARRGDQHVITPCRAGLLKQALYASFSAAAASAARLVRTPIMRLFMRSRRRVP